MKKLRPKEESGSTEISQHQQRRENLGRNSTYQIPPHIPFCSKTLPPDFLATVSDGEDSTRAGDNSSLFSLLSLSPCKSRVGSSRGTRPLDWMAGGPHGERSALEKFLKSKGSGPGCHTRPSLCVYIVLLIKGAGPGKTALVSRQRGRLLGNAQGPSPPRHQGGGRGSGRGCPEWKDESRSPAPHQVV